MNTVGVVGKRICRDKIHCNNSLLVNAKYVSLSEFLGEQLLRVV